MVTATEARSGVESDDRFTELYRRHHRAVWAYAVRRLSAGTDAADVAAAPAPGPVPTPDLARAARRVYSTTFGQLRHARAHHQATDADIRRGITPDIPTTTERDWTYAGREHPREGIN